MTDEQQSHKPLAGVRVVELAQWVAGPATGGLMADWGADVVKVEPPAGDPQRKIFAAIGIDKDLPNPAFAQDNRGKRSVVIDLADPDGLAAMDRLLETADVFVTNLRPGALDRLRLGPEDLKKRFPRLVIGAQSGYGSVGPLRDTAGYDIGAFMARTGLSRTNSPEPEPPIYIRSGFGDHVTAMATTMAVLAKLYQREATGVGGVVETSLFQTGLYATSWDVGVQLNFGKNSRMRSRRETFTPMVNSYQAGDERWFYLIGLEADRHFPLLCQAIDRPDLAADPRFATASGLSQNRVDVIAELDLAFGAHPLSHWSERFDEFDVWWAPCQALAEVVADPQAEAIGAFVETRDAGQTLRTVAGPARFDGVVPQPAGPVPAIGEHTDEVFGEINNVRDGRAGI